jgi:ABC-type dipeptide/oligopeptide/nickel transport system ATPase component
VIDDRGAPLLSVRDLTVRFATDGGVLEAIAGVGFDVPRGKVVGLMGESGCGKSVTALSIVRLLPEPGGRIARGSVMFDGTDLASLPERALERVRGKRIGFVFQDPLASLNPVYRVGAQIVEAIRLHEPVSRAAARLRAIELLRRVGVPQPEERIDAYPHELSGGMRQRVAIARTLVLHPRIILMDEPFGALDPSTRMHMQNLLVALWRELEATVFFITHSIEEAVFLGDRIYLLSSSPGRLLREIVVPPADKPAKDMQRDPKFLEMVFDIRDTIEHLEASKRAGDD